MIRVEVRLDLTNHLKVRKAIQQGTGPVKAVLDEYERLYRAFILDRFDRYSLGSGNWRRLKPATVRAKKKNKDRILVHTRFMRMKLQVGIKILRWNRNTVRFGFEAGMQHPDSDLTVAELATIHDRGLGPPRRRILVQPDEDTLKKMRQAAGSILSDSMNGK